MNYRIIVTVHTTSTTKKIKKLLNKYHCWAMITSTDDSTCIWYLLFLIYNYIVLHDADTADDTYWCLVPGTTCILTTTSKNH